jgi:hypothetical protein
MSSHRQILLALAGVALLAAAGAAQTPSPAERPRLVAAARGEVEVLVTRPASKRDGKFIVTTMRVQSKAKAPIAGLRVDEFWYGKGGDPVTGGQFRNPKPLQPNEVIDVLIKTPTVPDMDRNSYKFAHANGAVKTTNVGKIDMPKAPPGT